jgi:hypothetical protein
LILDPDDPVIWELHEQWEGPTVDEIEDPDDPKIIFNEIDLVANVGAWYWNKHIALSRRRGRKDDYFRLWIATAVRDVKGPGKETLRTLLHIYRLMQSPEAGWRWKVDACRRWREQTGFCVDNAGEIDEAYLGKPLPVLVTVDANELGKQLELSDQSVRHYLRLMARVGYVDRLARKRVCLIEELGRLPHGRKLYSLGWWHMTKDMDRPRACPYLHRTQSWKRALRRVAAGVINLRTIYTE